MKTCKQIADELGIDKQRVSRWVKNNLKDVQREASQGGNAVVLDEDQERQVKAYFITKAEKGSRTMQSASQNAFEDVKDAQRLELENAVLNERVRGLERENELLRGQVAQLGGALEREQQRARGFWSRLGQKLLGAGGSATK